jgi:hypothetical protein
MHWCARWFFGYIYTYGQPEVKAVFYAKNEREMNNAARTYVEELDDEYEKTK